MRLGDEVATTPFADTYMHDTNVEMLMQIKRKYAKK
jgi:hypothetical protein